MSKWIVYYALIRLVLSPSLAFGFEGSGYLKDLNRVKVEFEAKITRKYIFAPDQPDGVMENRIKEAVKIALAQVDTKSLLRERHILIIPLREALNEKLEFYGYKAAEVKITSLGFY